MPDSKYLMPQYLSLSHQNAQSLRRSAEAAEKQSNEIGKIRSELRQTRQELEKTRQEFADYKAQQTEQRKANAVQAQVDKKKQRRHEYLVAAFTVALTLFIEHFFDVVNLVKVALESLVALLK